ncbi:acetyltransferase (GNAT) family protein [Planomicrobium soli]|uniref:Lipid II:glycine glycyltransferase n=1 Tax=Planomicrobium soli TaxID=1176648 RepID=A0A2P8GQT7_9BACL|nr:GNAT family N-acetyltransferase [Planomicrobium soli]PSL36339.1 acetyltransferase (GNAT) family protein [Planomicrobium soli]
MTVVSKTTTPDIFFTPEWGKAYEKHDHGEMRVFEMKNEMGHVFYQFILRAIPIMFGSILYYDTITSFGLSGPIILNCIPGKRKELAAAFDKEFQRYCDENNIISEYVRFSSWVNNAQDFENLYGMDNRGITMYIDLTVEDYFMQEFKSGTRQQVRRALKNGVEIEYDYTGDSIKEFHRLYMIMAKKNDIPDHYVFTEELLAESFQHLAGKQFIVYAKYKGQYISGALFLHHGDYLHYHLAANDPDFFNFAGNSLVLNEGCRWGVDHGKKELHLGGASTDSLYRFKRGFTKTEPLAILTGKKVRNPRLYEILTSYKLSMAKDVDLNYFPAYRG